MSGNQIDSANKLTIYIYVKITLNNKSVLTYKF